MVSWVHKNRPLGSALTFLERYDTEDHNIAIVRVNETWMAFITLHPQSKQKTMEWRHSTSHKEEKFKQVINFSPENHVCCI